MAQLVTVELAHKNGLPEDSVVNTFVFTFGEGQTAADRQAVLEAVRDFYNVEGTPGSASTAVGTWIGSQISRVQSSKVRMYDISGHLDGSPHGSPTAELDFVLRANLDPGQDYPAEVACALRWEALGRADAPVDAIDGPEDPDLLPDRPKQRLTGRIYVGPLQITAGQADANGVIRPSATFRQTLADAGKRLADTSFPVLGQSSMRLGVWSRKQQSVTRLEAVAVDDAFDTQRRRGPDPGSILRLAVA